MAGCEVFAGGRWSALSASALRRRLLEAVLCGVSVNHRRKREEPCGIAPPESDPAAAERRSERLAELLLAEARDSWSGEEAEKRRKVEAFEELQSAVRRLQDAEEGGGRWREDAAAQIRRLAKDSPEARETLAMLGAIPPLVGFLDAEDSDSVISALYALLNLGIGNDANKSAIVKAGAVHKMLALIESGPPPAAAEAIAANFLGLSALDANKPIIGASSGTIPFLVSFFHNSRHDFAQSKDDALRALFNLSISPLNAVHLVDGGVIPCLLSAIGDDAEVSERSLSVLSNLVAAAPEGRQAVSRTTDAFPILVDVLNWNDAPGCQEKAAYILMVMAHSSRGGDRAAMAAAGISSALLELTLLGSPLAQKRASRILEILREEGKGKQISEGSFPVSAPIASGDGAAEEELEGMCEERRSVRRLVQQSLNRNMRRMAQRANLPPEFAVSDRFRELTASSTSKSLPLW